MLQTRGLIGDQVKQAVAPINADTDFKVRQLEQQGKNAVDQINANTQLQIAQMNAKAQAAQLAAKKSSGGGGGGGSGGSTKATPLTGEKLQSSLVSGAEERLQPLLDQQKQTVSATQTYAQTAKGEQDKKAALQTAQGAAEQARQAASYTGQAIEGEAYNAAGGALADSPAARAARGEKVNVQAPAKKTTGLFDAKALLGKLFGGAASAPAAPVKAYTDNPLLQASMQSAAATNPSVARSQAKVAADEAAQQAKTLADTRAKLTQQSNMAGLISQLGQAGSTLRNAPRPNPITGPVSELYAKLGLSAAQQGQAVIDNPQTLRDAMIASAGPLIQQGYKISDSDILNATGLGTLFKPGMSITSISRKAEAGQPTGAAEATAAAADEKKSAADLTTQAAQKVEDATGVGIDKLKSATGLDEQGLNQLIISENFPAQVQALQTKIQNGDIDKDNWDKSLATYLRTVDPPALRAILKAMVDA